MKNINLKKYFNEIKYLLLAIFITSSILLITFAVSGFAPFGERSILRVDLYHQYAPFHEELRNKILTGDSLFYSFEGGLGKNFLAQMAYYTFSPFSFFILFFPSNYLPEAILFFVFFKIVFCTLFFAIFLKSTFKTNNISIVIFAIMYSFIAYITSFYWNIMWLDSIALFPLVALGLERLIKYGGYKTYLIALFISILVNFYIAFLVCIFASLYFLVRVFSEYSIKNEYKIIFNRILKFTILSLIAGGLTMFLAIPTALAISNTATSDANFPKWEIYKNIFQIITNHFSGARPIILARNEDLPNVYSGVLTAVLLPSYFINKEIKLKEKVLFAFLILFMILCAVIKPLDFLIHGGHFPANLPHRYTFIYSFILLTLAFKSFKNIKGININILSIFSILYIIIILTTEYILVPKIKDIEVVLSGYDILFNIALIILYTLIIYLYKKFSFENGENFQDNKVFKIYSVLCFISLIATFFVSILYANGLFLENKINFENAINNLKENLSISFIVLSIITIIFILLISFTLWLCNKNKNLIKNGIISFILIIVSAEAIANSFNGFLYNGGTNRQNYVKYLDDTKDMLEYIKQIDTDKNKFYRQEFRRFTTINDASLYHYNGFSQFSSLAYGDTSKLIQLLGIAATSNSYRYYDPTPLINAMFNIKYIMNKDGHINTTDYEHIADFNTVSLYKNPRHLSIAFMVNENIKNWELNKNNPFVSQNEFIKNATNINENITEELDIIDFEFENINAEGIGAKNNYSYELDNPNSLKEIPTVRAKIINPKKQRLFFYIDSPNSSRFKYKIGEKQEDREISTGRSLIDFGIVDAMQEIEIEFSLNRKGEHEKTFRKSGNFKLFCASFENDIFEKAYKELEDEMLIINNYKSTKLEGEINVLKNGVLFTSIPYDKGWKVYIDGKKAEPLKIANGGLLAINLEKGNHNIIFKYEIQGFKIGIFISTISLVVLIFYIKYKNEINYKKY